MTAESFPQGDMARLDGDEFHFADTTTIIGHLSRVIEASDTFRIYTGVAVEFVFFSGDRPTVHLVFLGWTWMSGRHVERTSFLLPGMTRFGRMMLSEKEDRILRDLLQKNRSKFCRAKKCIPQGEFSRWPMRDAAASPARPAAPGV